MRCPRPRSCPQLRPDGAPDDRRDAAVQALLPGRAGAAVAAPHLRARSASERPTSRTWADGPPPHLLRDARQLLGRRLLQAGRGRVRLGALDPGLRLRPRQRLDHGLRAATGVGLGPDEEAIDCWRAIGVPDERIVRSAATTTSGSPARPGPCGPCSELYLDRGLDFGREDDRPGDDSERFLEFWNLVFMQYELTPTARSRRCRSRTSTPAWASSAWRRSSRTSPSVYETDALPPLIRSARSGRAGLRRDRHHPRPARAGRPRPRR